MPRIRHLGDLDWAMTALSAKEGLKRLNNKSPDPDRALSLLLFSPIHSALSGRSGRYDLTFDLTLNPEWHAHYQGEGIVLDEWGARAFAIGEEEMAPIRTHQLHMPSDFLLALWRLRKRYDCEVFCSWLTPSKICIDLNDFPEKVKTPTRFLQALAMKINRFAAEMRKKEGEGLCTEDSILTPDYAVWVAEGADRVRLTRADGHYVARHELLNQIGEGKSAKKATDELGSVCDGYLRYLLDKSSSTSARLWKGYQPIFDLVAAHGELNAWEEDLRSTLSLLASMAEEENLAS